MEMHFSGITHPTPQTTFASTSKHLLAKNLSEADEIREFPLGKVELVRVGHGVVSRATLQPGWRWSTSLKEKTQTETCQATHFQYQVSGRLHVKMQDGTEMEFGVGDVVLIPPGHDAWVVGAEEVVLVDFQSVCLEE